MEAPTSDHSEQRPHSITPENHSTTKKKPKTLKEVSEFYDIPLDELRAANPSLAQLDENDKIPKGSKLEVRRRSSTHVSAAPRTLREFAETFGVSVEAIQAANPNITNVDDPIPKGEKVKLPRKKNRDSETPTEMSTSQPIEAEDTLNRFTPEPMKDHTLDQQQDSKRSSFDVSAGDLATQRPKKVKKVVKKVVPKRRSMIDEINAQVAAMKVVKKVAKHHTSGATKTLKKIAEKYSVTMVALRAANPMLPLELLDDDPLPNKLVVKLPMRIKIEEGSDVPASQPERTSSTSPQAMSAEQPTLSLENGNPLSETEQTSPESETPTESIPVQKEDELPLSEGQPAETSDQTAVEGPVQQVAADEPSQVGQVSSEQPIPALKVDEEELSPGSHPTEAAAPEATEVPADERSPSDAAQSADPTVEKPDTKKSDHDNAGDGVELEVPLLTVAEPKRPRPPPKPSAQTAVPFWSSHRGRVSIEVVSDGSNPVNHCTWIFPNGEFDEVEKPPPLLDSIAAELPLYANGQSVDDEALSAAESRAKCLESLRPNCPHAHTVTDVILSTEKEQWKVNRDIFRVEFQKWLREYLVTDLIDHVVLLSAEMKLQESEAALEAILRKEAEERERRRGKGIPLTPYPPQVLGEEDAELNKLESRIKQLSRSKIPAKKRGDEARQKPAQTDGVCEGIPALGPQQKNPCLKIAEGESAFVCPTSTPQARKISPQVDISLSRSVYDPDAPPPPQAPSFELQQFRFMQRELCELRQRVVTNSVDSDKSDLLQTSLGAAEMIAATRPRACGVSSLQLQTPGGLPYDDRTLPSNVGVAYPVGEFLLPRGTPARRSAIPVTTPQHQQQWCPHNSHNFISTREID